MNMKIVTCICATTLLLLSGCSQPASDGNRLQDESNNERHTSAEESLLEKDNVLNLTVENMVGLWHKAPYLPAGWADRYFFYPDQTFRFEYNQMDGEKRTSSLSGLWKLGDDRLFLTINEKEIIEGGTLVKASGSTATEYEIEGGTIITIQLEEPEIVEYALSEMSNDDLEVMYRKTLWIGDEQYWKFNDTAEEY